MKITIESPREGAEDEIIIRCAQMDEDLLDLISQFKARRKPLTGYADGGIVKLSPKEIYYFESVDNRVFAYCEAQVYEVHQKLYELEALYPNSDFLRISKSVIVNISKIVMVSPMFGSRLEAKLRNGEKTIISRQYVPDLKRKLGIMEGGKR